MGAIFERIGIYGGTFSPIHFGHVRAALAFADSMKLDRLYVIPAATPPHKAAVAGATPVQRLDMVRLAFSGGDCRIEVSDFEILRVGKSYSFYTLEHFSKPERELYMLVGTDMFLTLNEWYRIRDIFRLTRIVLQRRENNPETLVAINEKLRFFTGEYGADIRVIDILPFEISSTKLRDMIRAGEPVVGLIPDSVIQYIEENKLYKNYDN